MEEKTSTVIQPRKKENPKTVNSRYIDSTLDFSFRHFFAKENHLDLLKDFLNSVFEGRKMIKDVKLGKTDRKGDQKNNRRTVFDVYCTGDNGVNFVVEMQKGTQANFKDRILFYTANLIQEQGRSVDSNWDYKLTEVYFVVVMDFIFENTPLEHYVHDVRLVEMCTKLQFYDKLGYIYIELPKFNKTVNELQSSEDKWLYCLKNMKTLNKIPLPLSNDPIFKKLFEVAEVSNLNPEEMSLYQRELKRKRDNYSREQYVLQNALKQGFEKGIEQGVEQGLAQGEVKGRLEERVKIEIEKREIAVRTALKLKKSDIAIELIADATGLTIEEIQAI
ncbi:Rpn family recombination-promoting nuclease/putative transposase [Pedobacter nyackensis]|uniref:Rpn family recombination-promoting nuclease/putative transposase n=1 Tax=Pedobacter nyackensis TaxID=475255 RepID=UPI00292E4513|nr:Rpn family recombination-promoting nuclease/putative transposase [Pedobacter nyackensis]